MIQVFRNSPVDVLTGGELTFTGTKFRKGSTAVLNNGGIDLNCDGVYMITANFSFTATAAGDVMVTMQVDGMLSAADVAVATAAAGDTVNVTVVSLIPVRKCGCSPADIGYIVSVAGTLVDADAVVTKLC